MQRGNVLRNLFSNPKFFGVHHPPTERLPKPWTTARHGGAQLNFDTSTGFERALVDDIFFVPKPVGFDPTAGDRFAANLYLDGSGGDDDKYRGFRAWRAAGPAEREGYYCRDSDQVE